MNKKIIAMITTLTILGSNAVLFSTTASAKTLDNNTKQEQKLNKDDNVKNPKISARIAGIVLVTAKSGANLRSGAGMGYSKVATAPYRTELSYTGSTAYDSQGNTWYSVEYRGRECWISSQVGDLG